MLVGIKHFLGNIKTNFEYLFLNYFVTNIPVWTIRKLFYRMFGMKIGKHARIMMKTIVQQPRNITIGENAIINEYCFLDGRGGLEIGKNASISIYTIILTGSHDKNSTEFAYRTGKVIIKNNVWIGARAEVYWKMPALLGLEVHLRDMLKKMESMLEIQLNWQERES